MRHILATTAILIALVNGAIDALAADFRFVEVDGESISVSSIQTEQATGADGAIVHRVTVRTTLAAALPALKSLSAAISNGGKPMASLPFATIVTSMNMEVTERRDYQQTSLTSITIDELDGQSKVALNVTLKFDAKGVSTKSGGKHQAKFSVKQKSAIASNFSVALKGLPSKRISKVSTLEIIPCGQRKCDSVKAFQIAIIGPEATQFRSWHEGLASKPDDARDGEIVVLTPDLKDSFFTIRLIGARPTSYSDQTTQIGTRATVGLTVARIELIPR